MDIKNPEYILEIARQQSVTHAAEKLFVTQSTLSQYLLKLENELGTPLFSREKSGLVPTEAGHVYLHAARAVVQIQNAAEASIAALKKEGFLCVGVSFWGLTLLTGLLPAFKSRFPDITLRIFVDDYAHLKVMMQAGRIDLAVISITEEDDRPAQGAVDLRREELVVALPREAAYCLEHPDAEFIPEKQLPQALDTLDFIALDEGASIRRIEDALFRRLMYRPHVICEVEREDSATRMVDAGVGAAILSQEDVRGVRSIRSFRLDPPLYRENIMVLRRGVKRTEALTGLEELLVAQARNK
ncbi:MAG: LysR family transcriptional regulator [Dysosmobacter sp.]|uniref:LysR family transcriptional regulator n=1 Tax=Dysosmobacter sp. TaxID=2591382 RepID=UPI00284A90B8|nr:LysR family transcriptional regulator [Dysosmobacter sp.]MDR3984153.1 LysR family transcriptional regulator [Dysosmobacter sp.]